MSKILIIVDMQNDFCLESGSLYVKGATLDLVEVYVQERYYNADDDYLPDDFEDEMKFEVDDPRTY